MRLWNANRDTKKRVRNVRKACLTVLLALTVTAAAVTAGVSDSVVCYASTGQTAETETTGEDASVTGRVLFISSYSYAWDTVPGQINGIKSVLPAGCTLDYQFMDTKTINDAQSQKLFYEQMRHEMKVVDPYDVVIVGDDAALVFAMNYRKELFPNASIVFEGVNDIDRATTAGSTDYCTGVVEELSYADTISAAEKMLPSATKLVAVLDDSVTGAVVRKQFYEQEENFPELSFSEINASSCTKEEFKQQIADVGDDTILLYLLCGADKQGKSYSGEEVISIFNQYAQVPVFRMSQAGVGQGLIGGKVVSDYESGAIAAKLALRILEGTSAADLPVITESPNYYYYDYQVLKKYNISTKLIDSNAVLINKNVSFIQKYSQPLFWIMLGLIIFFLLVSMILAIRYASNKERTTNLLKKRNRQLRDAVSVAKGNSEAKSAFLSRISHEIRTPLNAIIGITELTRQNAEDPERVRDNLDKLELSSKVLLGIINDVLDMSAIEQDKMALDNSPFSVRELVESLNAVYQPLCRKKDVTYTAQIRGLTEEMVMGDQLRVTQILNNLLSNSVKFTDAGGSVTLLAEQKQKRDKQVFLNFQLTDTGCGMSEDMQQRLFRPFEQENAKTAARYGGSGLGMAITGNLVAMMNGDIHVQSRKGEGTVFTVSLPFGTIQGKEPVQKESEKTADEELPSEKVKKIDKDEETNETEKMDRIKLQQDLIGCRLLLADDTEINLEITQELLQMAGFQVDCVKNGQEAVEAFAQMPPGYYDAILMDIQMPVMNGHEAARKIRRMKREDAAAIPIFAMTANAFSEDVARSLEAGMNGHIIKPVGTEELCRLLAGAIRKGRKNEKNDSQTDNSGTGSSQTDEKSGSKREAPGETGEPEGKQS